ncbi:MAG: LacI family DNA-binding transcriptional regulator, partial [Phycisphaeraceae bacterium JB051]
MPVTLQDIAKELNVSSMTVSRALRGVSRVSPEMLQK